jgi:hypothetical protein
MCQTGRGGNVIEARQGCELEQVHRLRIPLAQFLLVELASRHSRLEYGDAAEDSQIAIQRRPQLS